MKKNTLTTLIFWLTTGILLCAASDTTVKKSLMAAQAEPPTIDGHLNDTCWNDAPEITGFTDERTQKPAKNQTIGWIVYTDNAIYIGLHLYDNMPDKIVARQTKDQTRITGEDWVSLTSPTAEAVGFLRSCFIVYCLPCGGLTQTPQAF